MLIDKKRGSPTRVKKSYIYLKDAEFVRSFATVASAWATRNRAAQLVSGDIAGLDIRHTHPCFRLLIPAPEMSLENYLIPATALTKLSSSFSLHRLRLIELLAPGRFRPDQIDTRTVKCF